MKAKEPRKKVLKVVRASTGSVLVKLADAPGKRRTKKRKSHGGGNDRWF